jgi:hypothetical protein
VACIILKNIYGNCFHSYFIVFTSTPLGHAEALNSSEIQMSPASKLTVVLIGAQSHTNLKIFYYDMFGKRFDEIIK